MAVDVSTCSLSAVLPRSAAQRGAARNALLLLFFFSWEVFSLAPLRHPPVRRRRRCRHPLSLSSSKASRACVLRGCARVSPLSLFVGAGPTLRNLNALLVGRSSPDRRLIRSTPPLFPTPLNPFFLDTPPPFP